MYITAIYFCFSPPSPPISIFVQYIFTQDKCWAFFYCRKPKTKEERKNKKNNHRIPKNQKLKQFSIFYKNNWRVAFVYLYILSIFACGNIGYRFLNERILDNIHYQLSTWSHRCRLSLLSIVYPKFYAINVFLSLSLVGCFAELTALHRMAIVIIIMYFIDMHVAYHIPHALRP